MRVKELIEELKKQNPEAIVVVRSYEDGVDQACSAKPVTVSLTFSDEWYYGEYNIDPHGDTLAVFISNDRT